MTSQIIVQLNPDVPPTGSDLGIVNAARKSFGRRSEWDVVTTNDVYYDFDSNQMKGEVSQELALKDKDKRLLEFLARGMTAADFDLFIVKVNNDSHDWTSFGDQVFKDQLIEKLWQWRNTPTHDTPFNHGFFSFEVKAPVFVARHLVKHEYLIMSEYSRRYITDTPEFFMPTFRRKADDVKQGSGDAVSPEEQTRLEAEWFDRNVKSLESYEEDLAEGMAPEQARVNLPQSLMTSWTWSGTLGAFSNMCKLRLSSDTQAETREVAEAVYEELKKKFPVAAPLLVEGVI
jgi:thymidylate synthase (FAD)